MNRRADPELARARARARACGATLAAFGRAVRTFVAGGVLALPMAAWAAESATLHSTTAWLLAFLAGCLVGAAALSWPQRHRLRRANGGPYCPQRRSDDGAPLVRQNMQRRAGIHDPDRLKRIEGERLAWLRAQQDLLERLWRQVRTDPLTGLPSRRGFVAGLDVHLGAGVLAGPDPSPDPAGALLLLRVRGLDRLNRRSGREAGDGLLAAVGGALRSYHDRVPGALAGRLAGGDFALLLPVAGLAEETAAALHGALEPAAKASSGGVEILVAGVDALRASDASHALAQADEMLAQVESGAFNPAVRAASGARMGSRPAPGEDVDAGELWRMACGPAGELALGFAPVVDAAGQAVARLCALRLRGAAGGAWLGPRRWRPRLGPAGLLAQAELATVVLALAAVAPAGRLIVPLSPASAIDADFVASVTRRLVSTPMAASGLTLEIEAAQPLTVAALRAAVLPWAAAGATVSLLLRGASWPWLQAMADLGVSQVSVDVRFLRQAGSDAGALALVWQLALLAKALGCGLHAREVTDPADTAWLREAGFDTVSGQAVATSGDAFRAVGRQPATAGQPMSAQWMPK